MKRFAIPLLSLLVVALLAVNVHQWRTAGLSPDRVVADRFTQIWGMSKETWYRNTFMGVPTMQNPMDVWVSPDGATWEQVSDSPWNAESTDDIKYDFEGIAVGNVIYTFGGDRETFDFEDPTNYLRVDNDVWRYALPTP